MEIFKEIEIGGLGKEALIRRLTDAGVRFNDYAEILFEHSSFSPGHRTERVKLVKVKLSDLGLNGACSYDTIVDRGSSLGLGLCPLYAGAFLRLEYPHQPDHTAEKPNDFLGLAEFLEKPLSCLSLTPLEVIPKARLAVCQRYISLWST